MVTIVESTGEGWNKVGSVVGGQQYNKVSGGMSVIVD